MPIPGRVGSERAGSASDVGGVDSMRLRIPSLTLALRPRQNDPLSRLMSRGARKAIGQIRGVMAVLILGAIYLTFPQFPRWLLAWLLLGALYALYVLLPRLSQPLLERVFYDWPAQAALAGVNLVALTAALRYAYAHDWDHYGVAWLAYVLPLAIVAEYLPTAAFIPAVGVMAGALFWLQGQTGGAGLDWLVRVLWLALIGFVVHYVVLGERTYTRTLTHLRDSLGSVVGELGSAEADPTTAQVAVVRVCAALMGADGGVFWDREPWRGDLRSAAIVRADSAGRLRVADPQPVATLDPASTPVLATKERRPAYFIGRAKPRRRLEADLPRAAHPTPCFSNAPFELAAPIVSASTGTIAGVITVAYDKLPVLGAGEIQTLANELASITGVVSETYCRRVDHAREDTVLDLSRRVVECTGGSSVAEELARGLTDDLGYEFALVWVYDALRGQLRLQHSNLRLKKEITNLALPDDSGLIYTNLLARQSKEIVKGWDSRFDTRIWSLVKGEETVQAFVPLCVPDRSGQALQPVGLLQFGSRKTGTVPARRHLAELTPVMRAAGVALSNSVLRSQLEAEASQFGLLSQLATDLLAGGASRDRYDLVDRIAECARELLEADVIVVYSYDSVRKRFGFLSQIGHIKGTQPLRLIDPASPLLTRLVHGGQAVYVAQARHSSLLFDATGDPDDPSKLNFILRQRIQSFAGLPLMVGSHACGVMCVNYRKPRSFGEEERRLIALFANLAALALSSSDALEAKKDAALNALRERYSTLLHDVFSDKVDAISKRADGLAYAIRELSADPASTVSHLDQIGELAQGLHIQMVQVVRDLRGQRTTVSSLVSELERLVAGFQRFFEFEVHIDVDPSLPATSHEVQTALVSIAQEALSNACRHSGCKEAWLRCRCEDQLMHLEVEDCGIGLKPDWASDNEHYGLTNIWTQTSRLGGQARFTRPASGQGTLVAVALPLNAGG